MVFGKAGRDQAFLRTTSLQKLWSFFGEASSQAKFPGYFRHHFTGMQVPIKNYVHADYCIMQ